MGRKRKVQPEALDPPSTPSTALVVANTTTSGALISKRAVIAKKLLTGMTKEQVRDEVMLELGISKVSANNIIREVIAGWGEDYEADRATLKVQQLERLRAAISEARSAGKWSAVASLERLYADVAGTHAPVRVEVSEVDIYNEAIAMVAVAMTEEEIQQAVSEQLEIEALAAQARMLGLSLGKGFGGAEPENDSSKKPE